MFERDRSIVFQETLNNALIKNKFGFQEQDILPLFIKYQKKRQMLIDLFSFLTYVLKLPTQVYLRHLQKQNKPNVLLNEKTLLLDKKSFRSN